MENASRFTRTRLLQPSWLAGLGLGLLFALTRLTDLTRQAVHYDEASYMWWGQVAGEDWNRRFVSAVWGGRQPLHSWTISLVYRVWPDPLFAGRLAAGLAGAVLAAGLYLLARRLFGTRTALLAVLLYTLCPFTLLYDRHALTDSLSASEGVWIAYLALELLYQPGLLAAAGLALVCGATMLTRSLITQFAAIVPFALLAAPREAFTPARVARWAVTLAVALGIGWLIFYGAFGYAPESDNVRLWESVKFHHLISLPEFLSFPWALWQSNAVKVSGWLLGRLTAPLALLIVAALLALPWLGRKAWYVAAWGVLPTVGVLLLANHPYERYLLYGIPALLLLVAHAADRVIARSPAHKPAALAAAAGLAVLALAPALALDAELITGINAEPHSSGEYYFYGLYGARDYLQAAAATHPIVLIVDSPLTPVADGLAALLHHTPGVQLLRVRGNPVRFYDLDSGVDVPPASFSGQDVYYAAWSTTVDLSDIAPRLQLVAQFDNVGEPPSFVGLYRVRHFEHSELAGQIRALARPGDALAFLRRHVDDPLLADFKDLPWIALADAPAETLAHLPAGTRRLLVLAWDDDPAEAQQAAEDWLRAHSYAAGGDWYANVRLATYLLAPETGQGAVQPLDARAGDALVLRGYARPGGPAQPGDVLPIMLLWEPGAAPPAAYKVFVHLVDAQGQIVGQNDLPLAGTPAAAGQAAQHLHGLLVPPGLAPGTYRLRAGVYLADSGARLPLTTANGAPAEWVDLGEVQIVASSP
jgi:hypothetical protein